MNRCRWAMVLVLVLRAGSPGGTRPPAAVAPPPARDADRGGATATAPSASGGGIDFVERAAELGIAATYRNGGESDQCTILESLGGGVGWFDFDRDGWLDLVATGGGSAWLVRNRPPAGHGPRRGREPVGRESGDGRPKVR